MGTEKVWTTRPDLELILPELGHGGFGRVFKARNKIYDSYYAIKEIIISKALPQLHYKLQTLFQEVRLLQQINHPNIVRYFSCWLEGPDFEQILDGTLALKILEKSDISSTAVLLSPKNIFFIQTELCDNSLKNFLTDGKIKLRSNSEAEFLKQMLLQLSNALDAIHGFGIIHRDIHPGNIFTTEINEKNILWKIGDFGLAQTETEGLSIAGCTKYRSPDKICTKKSDVYSLGVVFIEILHHLQIEANNRVIFQTEMANLEEYLEVIKGGTIFACGPLSYLIGIMIKKDQIDRPNTKTVYSELVKIYELAKEGKIGNNVVWTNRPDLELILPELGSGRFGKVYKAFNKIEGCSYSIKEIIISGTNAKIHFELPMLLQELQILRQISHPNIVRYEFWIEGPDCNQISDSLIINKIPRETNPSSFDLLLSRKNVLFLQTELCDTNLMELLADGQFRQRSKSEPDIVKNALLQLSSALNVIHGFGIIHKNINPRNIFATQIDKNNILWKIGNFDLSLIESEGSCVIGYPNYRSPDFVMTNKSDIYSLGVVFIQILHYLQINFDNNESFQLEGNKLMGYLGLMKKGSYLACQPLDMLLGAMINVDGNCRPTAETVHLEVKLVYELVSDWEKRKGEDEESVNDTSYSDFKIEECAIKVIRDLVLEQAFPSLKNKLRTLLLRSGANLNNDPCFGGLIFEALNMLRNNSMRDFTFKEVIQSLHNFEMKEVADFLQTQKEYIRREVDWHSCICCGCGCCRFHCGCCATHRGRTGCRCV